MKRILAARRTSDGWLYFVITAAWSLATGGLWLLIWGDARLGLPVLSAGLFLAVFEVGILELARAAWLGMRLAVEAGRSAHRRREAERSGRLP